MKRKPSKAGKAPKSIKQARIDAEVADAAAIAGKNAVRAAETKVSAAKKALKSVERTAKKAKKQARRAKKALVAMLTRQRAARKLTSSLRTKPVKKVNAPKSASRKTARSAAPVAEGAATALPSPMPPLEVPPA